MKWVEGWGCEWSGQTASSQLTSEFLANHLWSFSSSPRIFTGEVLSRVRDIPEGEAVCEAFNKEMGFVRVVADVGQVVSESVDINWRWEGWTSGTWVWIV